jgi:hypothetical protein
MTLVWTEDPVRKLRLAIDYHLVSWPQFSPDGKLLAVGTTEGTVLVFEIEEITPSFAEIGLGWR